MLLRAFKFTFESVSAIQNASSSEERQEYRDTTLSGLVLRVGKSSKTYYHYRRGDSKVGTVKVRLGEHPQLTPAGARRMIREHRASVTREREIPVERSNIGVELTLAPGDEFLTTAQAAQLTNMSQSWYEHLRWRGEGPPYLKRGRLVRYLKNEVLAWWLASVRT